jgi:hypothetical protein
MSKATEFPYATALYTGYIQPSIAAISHFIESIECSIPPIELSIPRLHRSMRLINRSIRRIDRSIPAMEISIPYIHRSIPPIGESIRRSHRSIPPIKRSIRQDGRPIRRKEPRSPALARRSSRAEQSGLTFAPATSEGRHRPKTPGSTYARAPIHAPSQRSLSCNTAYAPETED